jgi:4-hydroxy-tetrahydrodipicolinate reductase
VDNLDRKERWGLHETKEGVLRIDDIRRKEVPGIHTITYDSPEDMITITHDAHGRKGFALGAVIAAEYTAQHNGLLTMEDLFQF